MAENEIGSLIRKAKGEMSWAELARRWQVTPEYIALVARGTKKPGPKILKALGLEKRVETRYVKAK